jgi:hypothetical protein
VAALDVNFGLKSKNCGGAVSDMHHWDVGDMGLPQAWGADDKGVHCCLLLDHHLFSLLEAKAM